MGLDMSLTGEKYFMNDWENPERNIYEDGFRVKSHNLELGHWHKHPDLHGYIIEQFTDGVDDYRQIELTSACIMRIIHAIRNDRLPKTSGFFFGESENDAEQKKSAIDIFTKAHDWLTAQPEGEWRSVYYQASW